MSSASHTESMTYHITKREPCGACGGMGKQILREGITTTSQGPKSAYIRLGCKDCNAKGYIETQVDADEWLLERLGEWFKQFSQYPEMATAEMLPPPSEKI